MPITLAGGASTQSRARRPLPPEVVRAQTNYTTGVRENVSFWRDGDDAPETRELLSWLGGQAGLLFGSLDKSLSLQGSRVIEQILETQNGEAHGSYANAAEADLAAILGQIYDPLLGHPAWSARFFANGSDACSAAVRLARAHTGRDLIASYGYHGAHSEFSHDPQSVGVPDDVLELHVQFEWGDLEAMRECAAVAACLFVEVPPVPDEEATAFLAECRKACDEGGALLVIDDVVLGFRVALGGSVERYGARPDILVLGKALSALGGIAAVLGREDVVGRLGSDVFYSTTFGGAPMACMAAFATLDYLIDNRHEVYGHLSAIGQQLIDSLGDLFGAYGIAAKVVGQPERSVMVFPSEPERRLFCGYMIAEGVLVDRPFFPTILHTVDDVATTVLAAERVLTAHAAEFTRAEAVPELARTTQR